MVELVNDEEDDELSNKAYQCLEQMGILSMLELLKELKIITHKRERVWKKGNTIMVDLFRRRERHIYCSKLARNQNPPTLRDFGP
mmetsp:Transcript_39726/g.38297  ORF Transcript_39726/g.38297 Transcript_39726/m.38297 type:complete len:85 (+) Transcript_39726:925-1179(+)